MQSVEWNSLFLRWRFFRGLMPNIHRQRRRDETVELRRVGAVYMNSQIAHDDCRRIRRCERSRRQWPSLQFCRRTRIWRNILRWVFVNIRISFELCSVIFVNLYNFFDNDVIMSSLVSTRNCKLVTTADGCVHRTCVASVASAVCTWIRK